MDLYGAFDLQPGAIVAVVGGGGKTGLVFALAREAAGRGLSALVTTTTKLTTPPGAGTPPVIATTATRATEDIELALTPGRVLIATTGEGDQGRLLGFTPEEIAAIAAMSPGLTAVRADGAADRPFKAPDSHEPAIPACASDVIVCVGLEVLGQRLNDTSVHRAAIAARLSDSAIGDIVGADTIVRVLTHAEGGHRCVPRGARLHALLNQPRTGEQERSATDIARRLVNSGFARAVVADVDEADGGIRAVLP
jgi:probable selenium-dependent hydroxylase accessory protein YqeC